MTISKVDEFYLCNASSVSLCLKSFGDFLSVNTDSPAPSKNSVNSGVTIEKSQIKAKNEM